MNLKAFITVKDGKGKILIVKEANSLVKALVYILCEQMGNALVAPSCNDTSGAPQTCTSNVANFRIDAAAGNLLKGIVVGTDNTAVTITDDALGTLIAHGNGATQLNYGAVGMNVPGEVASTSQFTISRTMTNNSGGLITVEETGIYVTMAGFYMMVERTVLNFAVPNTESRTVTYTIKVTV